MKPHSPRKEWLPSITTWTVLSSHTAHFTQVPLKERPCQNLNSTKGWQDGGSSYQWPLLGLPPQPKPQQTGVGVGFKRAGGRRCQLQRRDCCRNTEQGSGALLLEDGGEGARDTGDPLLADACRSHHARGRQTGLLSSAELKTNPKKTGLFNVIHSGYKYIKHYVFGD